MTFPDEPEPEFAFGQVVVLIDAVELLANGEVEVSFGSPAGRCRSQYLDRQLPVAGATVIAEIEFGEMRWAEDLRVVSVQPTGFVEEQGQNFVIARVMRVEGSETALEVETFAGAPRPLANTIWVTGARALAVGECVKVRTGRVALYPTHT